VLVQTYHHIKPVDVAIVVERDELKGLTDECEEAGREAKGTGFEKARNLENRDLLKRT
jgi:hypothetical protein